MYTKNPVEQVMITNLPDRYIQFVFCEEIIPDGNSWQQNPGIILKFSDIPVEIVAP